MDNMNRVKMLNLLQSGKVAEMINRAGALFIELPKRPEEPVKVFDHEGLKIGEITLAQAFKL